MPRQVEELLERPDWAFEKHRQAQQAQQPGQKNRDGVKVGHRLWRRERQARKPAPKARARTSYRDSRRPAEPAPTTAATTANPSTSRSSNHGSSPSASALKSSAELGSSIGKIATPRVAGFASCAPRTTIVLAPRNEGQLPGWIAIAELANR